MPKDEHFPRYNSSVCGGSIGPFINSTILTEVDGIIFCTGYLHYLPFLSGLNPHPVLSGRGIQQIYQHIFYAPKVMVSFVGLPRIVSFAVCEAQAAVIARVYSGRMKLSSIEIMQQWNKDMMSTRGDAHRAHTFRYPEDASHVNALIPWPQPQCSIANLKMEEEGNCLHNGVRSRVVIGEDQAPFVPSFGVKGLTATL